MLGGVDGVVFFISGLEQTQLKESSYFRFFFVYFYAAKGPSYSELNYLCAYFLEEFNFIFRLIYLVVSV